MNAYITDYALRHKTPIIPLGDSLRDAMAKMGIPIGGSNGNERQRELMRLASKIESKKEFYRSTIQLVLIAVLLVIGYYCRRRLRFTANGLNSVLYVRIAPCRFLSFDPYCAWAGGPKRWG